MADRTASVQRATDETDVTVSVDIDGEGRFEGSTGIGFLDHMLAQIAKHGMFDLHIQASGDLNVDGHHTAEDVGITLGKALHDALGDRVGIARMADATVPMDEALANVAVDLAGRDHLSFDAEFQQDAIGDLESSLIEHFIGSLARHLGAAVHVRLLAGRDDHHKAEAIFKALARALDAATVLDPRREGQVPSTKGTLEA